MKTVKLGNFEEVVLLLVGALGEEAYSVRIVQEYLDRTKKTINISAIHTVLYRLEEKGFLESYMGESGALRGGKRKRIFKLTLDGINALNELVNCLNIPNVFYCTRVHYCYPRLPTRVAQTWVPGCYCEW